MCRKKLFDNKIQKVGTGKGIINRWGKNRYRKRLILVKKNNKGETEIKK